MAKKRERQAEVTLHKNNAPSSQIDSCNSDNDLDLQDSWVVVKKQRVKILIPPLPVANISPPPNPRPRPVQLLQPVDGESQLAVEVCSKAAPIHEKPRKCVQLTGASPPTEYVPTIPKPIGRDFRRLQHCPSIFLDQGMLLNQKLRALNLERKLRKAGGLNRWLVSLGLGQFVRLFQSKSVSKFQLVNLTMKKLKDMGANAVGPRRKLMHAIDCFCQPCFY